MKKLQYQLLKLLSEKPTHLDFQEQSRLARNWKQDVIKLQQRIKNA